MTLMVVIIMLMIVGNGSNSSDDIELVIRIFDADYIHEYPRGYV